MNKENDFETFTANALNDFADQLLECMYLWKIDRNDTQAILSLMRAKLKTAKWRGGNFKSAVESDMKTKVIQ